MELAEVIALTVALWRAKPACRYSDDVTVIDAATWGEQGAWMVVEIDEQLLARFDSWALAKAMKARPGVADRLAGTGWQVPDNFVEQMELPSTTFDPPLSVERPWPARNPEAPREVALVIVQALVLVWGIQHPAALVYATSASPPADRGRCQGPWWPPGVQLS